MLLNANLARVASPPIMAIQEWVRSAHLPDDQALLNLSQAAPVAPPPEALRRRLADALMNETSAHLYGPVLGNTELREEIAGQWSKRYGGQINPHHVAVTAGCNQAFCVAASTACAPGDAMLIPAPWYFNHKMWLDMSGVDAVPLPCDEAMLPDLDAAKSLMTDRVRAILLVTPNNPTGAEYPAALLEAFYDLACDHGTLLIVDETYRDFLEHEDRPHALFARPDWEEVLVHLYSFSKVFRLTGHRTGALIAGAERIVQAEKVLDTVTICPSQSGQIAALFGLRELEDWVAEERAEILTRRAKVADVFSSELPDWQIRGLGAYFAWVEAPFGMSSETLARRLLAEQSLLVLPGSMFMPEDDTVGLYDRCLRIAFANADVMGLAEMGRRLTAFRP